MRIPLSLLAGALLVAAQAQPRIEHVLAGPLGIAQQASLNHLDILVDLSTTLPPSLALHMRLAVASAQRAHEVAVRNLIVVERGTVTADYRRWKLRRTIKALVRADRERERVLKSLLAQVPLELVPALQAAMERARQESTRAVSALRALDGGTTLYGGAGAASSDWNAGKRNKPQLGKEMPAAAGAPTAR